MSKILIDRSTVEQALEALETLVPTKGPSIYNSARDAIRTALAQQDESEAYGYASRLAVAIWEKNYKDIAPQWKPLDYLIGVLTQIDNMTSGLTRQAEPVQEPVAWMCSNPELMAKGYERFSSRCEGDWNIPVYLSPPQRKPLTEEKIAEATAGVLGLPHEIKVELAREVERAHGIGEQP